MRDVLHGPELGNAGPILTGCLKTVGKVVEHVLLKVIIHIYMGWEQYLVLTLVKDVLYSKAQKMLKLTFNALIQQQSSYYVSYSYSQAYKIVSQHTI